MTNATASIAPNASDVDTGLDVVTGAFESSADPTETGW